jgi:isoleucyl-tRNA synthetase
MEEQILAFWEKNNIFKRSIEAREGKEEFVFYDGPPFATGLPHFGHFVPGTIKDIIPRYHTMKGKKVERRFGWDCHGLPVEYEMEKELGISGKKQIEDYGIANFNEACRSIVLRYTNEWRAITTRLGRWVDFGHEYRTMDTDYMESIWWVVSELWKKKLVYEGFYILPYCPRCSTALSNFELNQGGYKDVHDPALTIKFKLKDESNTFILAWTTTPWTLPSNLALALGKDIEYVKIKDKEENYILAKDLLGSYYKDEKDYEILKSFKGSELAGLRYEPLFPYFKDLESTGAFRTFLGDFVSTEDGTGIVHIAPGFGEDDYSLLKGTGIPVICPVDAEGKFENDVTDYAGVFVKDADKTIIKDLKAQGKVVKHAAYLHSYPHCWRCSSPLIYKAISSWFVKVEDIKEKMLAANAKISWMPDHLKDGRFGKWLSGARDWAISRSRYWGNPIPIWRCPDCGKTECIGSRKELEEKSGKKVADLHKHFIDDITFACSCGKAMKRIPEVLDCWFESGAMPYAQNHYPFENKTHFEEHYPADFIAEGLDQTRGWFYTLTVLAAALFDKPAFMHVVVNGLVLDSEGKKMSKSLRNYTDPSKVMDEFGADALRLFLMRSAVVKAEDLKYSDVGVRDVLKNVIIPLWNSYYFFVTYANVDNVTVNQRPENPQNPLDRWILSACERMVLEVTEQLDKYDLQKAIDPIVGFIDILNNWYIRRSRRRFWKSENDIDKNEAYRTLGSVLTRLVLCASPFIPFTTEEIYSNIKPAGFPESVHLCDFPEYDGKLRDTELEEKMEIVLRAITMGRNLRTTHNLKTRQPLSAIHLVTRNQKEKKILAEMEDIIRDELNVKAVVFRENEEELVEYKAKANYKALGKELGKDMKKAAEKIETLSMKEIRSLLDGSALPMTIEGKTFELRADSVSVTRIEKENLKVINDGSLTIALDPELTPALVQEGMVRDIVRSIQNRRKEMNLNVTDRIVFSIHGPEIVKAACENFWDHLASETLAVSWKWESVDDGTEIECGDVKAVIGIVKA